MKYLLIHHSTQIGGGTLSFNDILKVLRLNNQEYAIILPEKDSPSSKFILLNDSKVKEFNIPIVTFHFFNGGPSLIKASILFFLKSSNIKHFLYLLEELKPEIVILNSIVLWPLIPSLKKRNIKVYFFIRETMKGKANSIINRIISHYLSKLDGISFLSNFDRHQWNISKSIKQKVIPDLVDINSFKESLTTEIAREKLNLDVNVFYILYVGGISELKGVEIIIKAMNKLKNLQIKLLILGNDGKQTLEITGLRKYRNIKNINFIKNIYSFIKNNGLSDQIEILGTVENINQWYAASNVVVFPAKEAHQARPIYEAGVFKKPVIVSNYQNFNEYLIDGYNGLVFEPNNFNSLSTKIKKLYNNKKLTDYLGENNFTMTTKFHNSSDNNKLIEEFIEID